MKQFEDRLRRNLTACLRYKQAVGVGCIFATLALTFAASAQEQEGGEIRFAPSFFYSDERQPSTPALEASGIFWFSHHWGVQGFVGFGLTDEEEEVGPATEMASPIVARGGLRYAGVIVMRRVLSREAWEVRAGVGFLQASNELVHTTGIEDTHRTDRRSFGYANFGMQIRHELDYRFGVLVGVDVSAPLLVRVSGGLSFYLR